MQFDISSILLIVTVAGAQYVLVDDYFANGDFFDKFSFWDAPDPTNGFVLYQSRHVAEGWLIRNGTENVRIVVDSIDKSPNGRPSVRLTSLKSYQSGLIVLDVDHMPGGICGTWPAFWTVGPDWPTQGEIDIIEGVNDQRTNNMALHTGLNCSIRKSSTAFSGNIGHSDCTSGAKDDQGCQISTTNTLTYGLGFNDIGGGVYAAEWTRSAINIFFFPRGSMPIDLATEFPNPTLWGEPSARFQGDCNIAESFTNQNIVFDTTFCGDWAGEVWSGSTCALSTQQTCEEFVAQNPLAFADAYWSINALKVYEVNYSMPNAASISSPYKTARSAYGTANAMHSTLQPYTNSSSAKTLVSATSVYAGTATDSQQGRATVSSDVLHL